MPIAFQPQVVSVRHFDGWWKKQRHKTPDLLTFTREDLLRVHDTNAERPDNWTAEDLSLPLTYGFEPGAADDGVTVHIPVEVLARLGGDEFGWQVPALREELVTALIKSLPKDCGATSFPRRTPLARCSRRSSPDGNRCWRRCSANCRRTGVLVPISAFDLASCPPICG